MSRGSQRLDRVSDPEFDEIRRSLSAVREQLESRFGPDRAGATEESRVSRPGPAVPTRRMVEVGNLEFDPLELFDQARDWISRLRRETRSSNVDEFGLDPVYLARVRPWLDFLFEHWWRVEVSGSERLEFAERERVLLVSNRSGVLPYDGLMISHAVERQHPTGLRPRFLVADWLVTLPFSQPSLARVGGVRACPENAERLLSNGEWVVAFPEGQKGALKHYRDRYRLARFGRGGFVSLAVRARATIIPVSVVGAEEVHPILWRPELLARLLGVPVPFTPTFPLLGPLGLVPLPSRWRICFGEPLRFDRVEPDRAEDPLYISRAREEIRESLQSLVDAEVDARGSAWR